jgi:outer membrane lipoprotein-sorting protein
MKKLTGIICLLALLALFASVSGAAAPSLDDVVKNLQANQGKIKDMYAETTTTVTSNMTVPGQESKGPQKMVQTGKLWTKGETKSKVEILSPLKQITITNGDQMAIINPETGQKVVQDLKKMRGKSGQGTVNSGQMSLDKAKEYFDLSLSQKDGTYVITGVPRQANKFLGKMEFYVDASRWVPTNIFMYDAKGKLMSQSAIEYEQVSGLWVPARSISNISTPMGKMNVDMSYENIKVNEGIGDGEFRVE